MAHSPRVKLSVGPSSVAKTVTVIFGALMVVFSACVVLGAVSLILGAPRTVTSTLPDGEWHIGEDGKLAPGPGDNEPPGRVEMTLGISTAVCALLFIILAGYLILRVLRSAAWLEGSELHVRGALRGKSVDLATARVSGGSRLRSTGRGDRNMQRVETITAHDPSSGKSVTLPLRGAGMAMLPAEELRMLANAITNTRARGGSDDSAFAVADRLRQFATDPFS